MKRATPKRAEQDAIEFGSLDRNDVEAKLLFHSGLVHGCDLPKISTDDGHSFNFDASFDYLSCQPEPIERLHRHWVPSRCPIGSNVFALS
jgi:hypothetical protein